MVLGVGIDLVQISRMEKLISDRKKEQLLHLFSREECERAFSAVHPAEAFSGYFAVKEAVYKALCPLLPEHSFEPRLVQTRHEEFGAPKVEMTPELMAVLRRAEAEKILISITHDGDYAGAIALVCDSQDESGLPEEM